MLFTLNSREKIRGSCWIQTDRVSSSNIVVPCNLLLPSYRHAGVLICSPASGSPTPEISRFEKDADHEITFARRSEVRTPTFPDDQFLTHWFCDGLVLNVPPLSFQG